MDTIVHINIAQLSLRMNIFYRVTVFHMLAQFYVCNKRKAMNITWTFFFLEDRPS